MEYKIKKKKYTEKKVLELLKKEPFLIKYIKNPTYEMERIAIITNGFAIRFLKKQTKELQKLAVIQSHVIINYLIDHDDEILEMAKRAHGKYLCLYD